MNIKVQKQKMQMQVALNHLCIIEICEQNIKNNFEADYYNNIKSDYAKKYAEVMATIVGEAITISKVDLFNEKQY